MAPESSQTVMDDGRPLESYPDRFREMFVDKTLLVSGGTGFLGKVLIEKVLRCCPEVKRIYIIVRPKKGKDVQDRLRELFKNAVFNLLKEKQGEDVMKKVVAIAGDMSEKLLGVSESDRQILKSEVNFMYHCAASVRFDEPLKSAVLLNVRGTKEMLDLAHEVENLELFCHVSTAYCHLEERVLYEKTYPPPDSPLHVIKTVEWMDDEVLEMITPKILGNQPNTYAYTKALGEGLVNDQMDKLPVIIVRPSVVIPIWKDPLPGWTDNINGPTGLLIGAGKGVIRTMYCKGNGYADYLPVDVLTNAMIAASFIHLYVSHKRVFNFTSSSDYKITHEEVIEIGREVINNRIPLNGVVWYPGGSMKKNKLIHYVCVLLFHLIPAVFIDGLVMCLGYKPFMLRIHRRILKGFDIFEYYANNQWDFNNDETLQARELLNPLERSKYPLFGDGIDYHDYFTECVKCARRYILNEPDDTIPSAKRHMAVMYYVDKISKTLILLGFAYLLYTKVLSPMLDCFF